VDALDILLGGIDQQPDLRAAVGKCLAFFGELVPPAGLGLQPRLVLRDPFRNGGDIRGGGSLRFRQIRETPPSVRFLAFQFRGGCPRRFKLESEKADESPEDTAENIIKAAYERAERIIEDALREAEAVMEQRRIEFEDELLNLKEETLKEAFDEGYGRGYTESRGVRAQADAVLQSAEAEKEATINNLEPELVELIAGVTHKLIANAAQMNPHMISLLIRQGLDSANAPGDVVIHVSPLDYEEAVKYKDEYFSHINTGARVDILKDLSLNKSDCVIETPYGNIDCSLEQQYASLTENLFYILEN